MPSILQVAAAVFGAVSSVTAAPVELDSRAVSTTVYDKLLFYSQYSAAAYCLANNDSPNTKVTCAQGNCPLVEAANTTTVSEFENSILTDVTGFVATDTTNKLIVLAFRGSRSIRNWITDVVFPVVPTTICSTCLVSDGFWTSWLEAQSTVLTAIASAQAQYPDYQLVATGHSLGGALASIAAGILRSQGKNIDLYTYGSPRVGLDAVADYLSKTTLGQNYRVTHLHDPVPKLPPAFLGYRHVSPEYYITAANNVSVTPADISVIQGTVNFTGNAGDLGLDPAAHGWYFDSIDVCEGTPGVEFKV
ncbi:hypothetical protein ACEQ8H_003229 [Pleosporales sp. CAS-2024a]